MFALYPPFLVAMGLSENEGVPKFAIIIVNRDLSKRGNLSFAQPRKVRHLIDAESDNRMKGEQEKTGDLQSNFTFPKEIAHHSHNMKHPLSVARSFVLHYILTELIFQSMLLTE